MAIYTIVKGKNPAHPYAFSMKKVDGLGKIFGRVLAEERGKKNMSQEQLAEMIDSNNVYVCLLENGQRQPSLNAVILLAQALKISPAELMQRVCDKLSS